LGLTHEFKRAFHAFIINPEIPVRVALKKLGGEMGWIQHGTDIINVGSHAGKFLTFKFKGAPRGVTEHIHGQGYGDAGAHQLEKPFDGLLLDTASPAIEHAVQYVTVGGESDVIELNLVESNLLQFPGYGCNVLPGSLAERIQPVGSPLILPQTSTAADYSEGGKPRRLVILKAYQPGDDPDVMGMHSVKKRIDIKDRPDCPQPLGYFVLRRIAQIAEIILHVNHYGIEIAAISRLLYLLKQPFLPGGVG